MGGVQGYVVRPHIGKNVWPQLSVEETDVLKINKINGDDEHDFIIIGLHRIWCTYLTFWNISKQTSCVLYIQPYARNMYMGLSRYYRKYV